MEPIPSGDELREAIARIKPVADAAVDAADALNAALQAAVRAGLSVQVDVLQLPSTDGQDELVPSIRLRISKRIV